MNKPVLFISFFICNTLGLIAQPTITSSSYLGVGSSVTLSEATALELDTTKGANITWNFSSLVVDPDFSTKSITYVNPNTSPFISLFPTANVCYKDEEDNIVRYHYFIKSASSIERIGSAAIGSPTTTYTNSQTDLVFPFTFGTTNIDAWENSSSSFGGTLAIDGIGYGTLILPNNRTYNNIQLMRATIDELIPFVIYYWLNEQGETLAFYTEGDGLFIPVSVRFATNITSVAINELKQTALSVYYLNPIETNFTLQLPAQHEKLSYTLTTILGQVLTQGEINPNESTFQLNMENFGQGMYYFTANGKEQNIAPITLIKR